MNQKVKTAFLSLFSAARFLSDCMDAELVKNRRAFYDYSIEDTFEAGVVLLGSEVKSLKNHGGSLQDAYVVVRQGELWLIASSIAPYKMGSASYNHEERRERKLLMHQQEIEKLKRKVQEKGFTLIPLSFYLKKGKIKIAIAIAKGKKTYDKRKALQAKEDKKAIQRALKGS